MGLSVFNAERTAPIAASAMFQGLSSFAESAAKMADQLRRHPDEVAPITESAVALNKQFTDLLVATSKATESGGELQRVAEETLRATDWIGNKYPSGSGGVERGGLVQTIPVENAFAALWQRHGG